MTEAEGRAAIVAEARAWIGTPFRDHGEVKGRNGGVDCAKFIKLVFRNVGLIDDLAIPHYSPQIFLHKDTGDYVRAVLGVAFEILEAAVQPGDIVLYKLGRDWGHGAIILPPGWPAIIHAHAASRLVVTGTGLDTMLRHPARQRRFFSHWRDGVRHGLQPWGCRVTAS